MALTNYIPVRRGLVRDPATRRIARTCNIPPAHAVGCLVVLWAIADEYGDERAGHADVEWTFAELDAECGIEGFCAAMAAAGWLAETATGARFVGYAAKAGGLEKRRMKGARRQAMWRASQGKQKRADRTDSAEDGTSEPLRAECDKRDGDGITTAQAPSPGGRDTCSADCSAPHGALGNTGRNTRRVTQKPSPHHTTPPTPETPHHGAPRARDGVDGVSRGNGHGWLTDIRMDDLTDTTRLLALYDRAVAAGLIPSAADGRLRFVTLAERALRVARRAGNPPALFASLISRPDLQAYVTGKDERRAEERLKAHGMTGDERAAERGRHHVPTREADRDEVLR